MRHVNLEGESISSIAVDKEKKTTAIVEVAFDDITPTPLSTSTPIATSTAIPKAILTPTPGPPDPQ